MPKPNVRAAVLYSNRIYVSMMSTLTITSFDNLISSYQAGTRYISSPVDPTRNIYSTEKTHINEFLDLLHKVIKKRDITHFCYLFLNPLLQSQILRIGELDLSIYEKRL